MQRHSILITVTPTAHYNDVTMSAIASQITGVSIVYLTVCSDVDKINYQSSASLAFVGRIHRWPVNSPHKGPVTRKMFPFYDVIMNGVGHNSRSLARMVSNFPNRSDIFHLLTDINMRHPDVICVSCDYGESGIKKSTNMIDVIHPENTYSTKYYKNIKTLHCCSSGSWICQGCLLLTSIDWDLVMGK